jgi:DNA-binding transcriptional LysR family regulator
VRIGTVHAATVPLLAPAIRQFRELRPATHVAVIGGVQAGIQRGLLEGGIDLGRVNCPEGDDLPPELDTTSLLVGKAVVCVLWQSRPRFSSWFSGCARAHRRVPPMTCTGSSCDAPMLQGSR